MRALNESCTFLLHLALFFFHSILFPSFFIHNWRELQAHKKVISRRGLPVLGGGVLLLLLLLLLHNGAQVASGKCQLISGDVGVALACVCALSALAATTHTQKKNNKADCIKSANCWQNSRAQQICYMKKKRGKIHKSQVAYQKSETQTLHSFIWPKQL